MNDLNCGFQEVHALIKEFETLELSLVEALLVKTREKKMPFQQLNIFHCV